VQPEKAFVAFLQNDADLCGEFRPGAGTTGDVVVRADGSGAPHQLASYGPGTCPFWKPIHEPHDADSKLACAFFQLVGGHGGEGILLIADVKLQIFDYGARGAHFFN
jgi:hypothetical protein